MQGDIETDEEEHRILKEEYDGYIDDRNDLTPEETTEFHEILSKMRQVS